MKIIKIITVLFFFFQINSYSDNNDQKDTLKLIFDRLVKIEQKISNLDKERSLIEKELNIVAESSAIKQIYNAFLWALGIVILAFLTGLYFNHQKIKNEAIKTADEALRNYGEQINNIQIKIDSIPTLGQYEKIKNELEKLTIIAAKFVGSLRELNKENKN